MYRSPQWQHFPVTVLRLEFMMTDRFTLPPFAGSMFRGALGWSLKEVCEESVYRYLFETTSSAPGRRDASRPFLLVPPLGQRKLRSGDRFQLALRLWGEGTKFLPEMTYALMLAGEWGLGREKAKFELTKVIVDEGPKQWVAYDHALGWDRAYLPMPSALGSFSSVTNPARQIEVDFLTPTRLVSEGTHSDTPDFPILIHAAYRRVRSLLELHGAAQLLPTLLDDIESTHQIESYHQIEWVDWERTSQRQKKRHIMGGLVGRSLYRGEFQPEWLEVLKACEILHLGKATTFGMGGIRVTENVD